jgi:hypothetical protein
MSTEPAPLTLAEAMHRAAWHAIPRASDRRPDAIARFEDRDEAIAGMGDLDMLLAEEFGALDPKRRTR